MRSIYIGLLSSVANIEGPIVIYLVVEGRALAKGGALVKGIRFAYVLVYRCCDVNMKRSGQRSRDTQPTILL